jgi:hypothetical protein
MGTVRAGEPSEYVGILFVREDAIRALARVGADGAVDAAQVEGETVEVSWRGGSRSRLPWRMLRERAGLDSLPAPRLAFAGEGEIGLLITSETPRPHLRFREPHSVVQPIGVLTTEGLRHD